jgi:tetratricopeptide (TPR) repeat protein
VAAIDFVAMVLFGYASLTYEICSVFQASSLQELSHGRAALWNALVDGIAKFPLLGTGIGSHSEVYPVYMEEFYDAEFTHGESGYLPLLLEAGICGLALMITGIAVSFSWCLRALTRLSKCNLPRNGAASSTAMLVSCICGIAPSLLASVIHSIADFVWYIPGCMVMTIAQVACACRLYQLAQGAPNTSAEVSDSGQPDAARYSLLPQWVCVAMSVGLLLTTIVMAQNLLGPALGALDWDAYLKHSIVRNGAAPRNIIQETERLDAMERHLVSLLRHSPQNARAHLRLAAVYLKQFELKQRSAENSMDLSQIRDAALASAFPSKAAQDAWLAVAIGDSRHLLELAQTHSRRALQLSPLQGIGYIQLAELSFLDSPLQTTKSAYINQAARVRPNSGPVLFTLGKEAALSGNLSAAFQHWKKAFLRDPEIRQVMIDTLADQIPCDLFVSSFEPDTQTLEQLFQHYQVTGRIPEARFVGLRLANRLQQNAQTKSPREAASYWRRAQETFTWLGDMDNALHCQRSAVGLAPLDFDSRLALARLLTKQHHYPEAIEQFEWCVRRQPDNESLRNEFADAKISQVSSTQTHVAEKTVRP